MAGPCFLMGREQRRVSGGYPHPITDPGPALTQPAKGQSSYLCLSWEFPKNIAFSEAKVCAFPSDRGDRPNAVGVRSRPLPTSPRDGAYGKLHSCFLRLASHASPWSQPFPVLRGR